MAKKILIVEDEPDVMLYLNTLFEEHGYETATAANGKEGAKKVEEVQPDLICLDLLMPEKSGIALYRELKHNEDYKKIPVVMVTGFKADEFPMIDFKKFIYERSVPGPEAYIEKPIDRDRLLEAIGRILEDH
jgi:CheY-like chemotaxis protein